MIYESRRGREDMSGPVQNYRPSRVFSFLNPSPFAPAFLYGEMRGVKLVPCNDSPNADRQGFGQNNS